jgi:hypothetical protein
MAIPGSFRQDLGDIPILECPGSLRMRSRDFFTSYAGPGQAMVIVMVSEPPAAFQRMADPYGLMNAGKLKHWQPHAVEAIA